MLEVRQFERVLQCVSAAVEPVMRPTPALCEAAELHAADARSATVDPWHAPPLISLPKEAGPARGMVCALREGEAEGKPTHTSVSSTVAVTTPPEPPITAGPSGVGDKLVNFLLTTRRLDNDKESRDLLPAAEGGSRAVGRADLLVPRLEIIGLGDMFNPRSAPAKPAPSIPTLAESGNISREEGGREGWSGLSGTLRFVLASIACG
jgi:hypothetical protein